jgi:drug/metabolite transporter (DMT)-like permease
MTRLSGYFALICSALLFGAGSIVIKFTYQSGLTPEVVLVTQIGIAVLISWTVVALRDRKKVTMPRALWRAMVLQGAIAGGLTSLLFFYALDQLGASLATLLLFTFPALIALYHGIWCKIPIKKFQRIALILALLGLLFAVDVFHTQLINFSGESILIGIGAAITNAFGSINGEKLLNKVDTFVVTAWSYTFSFLTLLCLYRPEWLFYTSFSVEQSILLISGAVLNFAPLACYFFAITRIGSGIASIVSTLEIPITLLLAYAFLGETMIGIQLAGGILITVSVFLLYYGSWKSTK